jgi:hypothetical protein
MVMLSRVAAEPWNGPASPSIWPEIEAQIQHRGQRPRPAWERLLSAICPERLRLAAVHVVQSFDRVRGEAPLQLAWARDSLHEVFQRQPLIILARIRSAMASPLRVNHHQFVFGFGLTAAMILLLVLTVTQRRAFYAKAQSPSSSAPVPILEGLSQKPLEQKMDVIIATEPVTNTRASNSLAQVEEVASLESLATGPSPSPVKAVATATSETTSAPTSSARYDFYLEHGTPMPPESRGGKPAY